MKDLTERCEYLLTCSLPLDLAVPFDETCVTKAVCVGHLGSDLLKHNTHKREEAAKAEAGLPGFPGK